MHPPLAFVGFDDMAEIGLVVGAMFAILVLAGLWLIITIFADLIRRIPVVGPPIANGLEFIARGFRTSVLTILHGTLWAAGKVFHGMAVLLDNMFGIIRNTLDALAGVSEHTVNVIIPREIRGARSFALRMANRALTTALDYARSVRADAWQWYLRGRAYTDQQVAAARNSLVQLIRTVYSDVLARIANLRAQTQIWVGAATARADRQFAQAEADAHTLAQQAQANAIRIEQNAVDGQAREAWAPVWAGIMAGVAGAIQVAGSDFPQITRQLQQIATEAPATLTEAEAAAARAVPPMMTALRECVLPQCRDLGPLRSLMHQIGDALFTALLLAWIIQMVTDPEAWARETYDAFTPLIDGELGIIRALAGI